MAKNSLAIDRAQRSIALQGNNGTMTKGNAKGGQSRVDAASWLSNIRPESLGPAQGLDLLRLLREMDPWQDKGEGA